MKIKKEALRIIKEADSKGYVVITGNTKEERAKNILNFFDECFALEAKNTPKPSTSLIGYEKERNNTGFITKAIKKASHI